VVGETGPDDFSAGADAARAYFACVNANGGINGRPIDFRVEDDQWNPEVAAQVAAKLVKDVGVVAMAGSGSFVEMTVNARLYEDENLAVVASACAVRECFESRNIASTNQGPVPSNILSTQWAVANLGTRKVACVALNIPSNGVWSCDQTIAWLESQGLEGTPVLFDPGSADLTAVLLEAVATGADTILVSLPANLGVAFLKAAEEQDLRDRFNWIAPTPLYKQGVPEALGDYWSGKVFLNIELTPWDRGGPDAARWLAVMDKYGRPEDPRDTFGQAGFVSAMIVVDTLLKMDPATLDDRASVTAALKGVRNFRTDLLCGPWYFGEAERHQPNHAGVQMVIKSTGFEVVQDCFEVTGGVFDDLIAKEKAEGLTGD
jgi:branched-chain amino acid transport system substrate-binding protein